MAEVTTWHFGKPANPVAGDTYMDLKTGDCHVYIGTKWVLMATSSDLAEEPKSMIPTEEQLEKYPALKEAWEQYIIIKKLLGV